MKAVILAAGEGRRLTPLTNRRPKPMLPVANRPLLEYVVEACIDAGIDQFVLVVGHKRERIQTYFGDGDDWGVDIEYAVQDKQLGTGHAVLQAEPYVDDDFVVCNGDRIIESELVAKLVEANGEDADAAVAVTRSAEPSEYGVVELDGDRVAGITEKPRAAETRSDLINAGVYGFSPGVFDVIRETETDRGGEWTLTAALARLVEQARVRAVRYRGMWVDVSNLWDLLRVNGNALDRRDTDGGTAVAEGVTVEPGAQVADAAAVADDVRVGANTTVRPGVSLGPNVSVGAGAVVSNAVVFRDAVVEDGAVVRDCVVGANAHVGANATVAGGQADVVVGDTVHQDVHLGAVLGDNASVGGGCVLAAGTVVGDGATVEEGTAVGGTVGTDAEVRRG